MLAKITEQLTPKPNSGKSTIDKNRAVAKLAASAEAIQRFKKRAILCTARIKTINNQIKHIITSWVVCAEGEQNND